MFTLLDRKAKKKGATIHPPTFKAGRRNKTKRISRHCVWVVVFSLSQRFYNSIVTLQTGNWKFVCESLISSRWDTHTQQQGTCPGIVKTHLSVVVVSGRSRRRIQCSLEAIRFGMKIDKSYYLVSTTITTFSISNLEKKKERKPFSLCFFFFFRKNGEKGYDRTREIRAQHKGKFDFWDRPTYYDPFDSQHFVSSPTSLRVSFTNQNRTRWKEERKKYKKKDRRHFTKEKKKKYKILLGNFRTSKNLLRPDFFFSK